MPEEYLYSSALNPFHKSERKLLKAFLLRSLYTLLHELSQKQQQVDKNYHTNTAMECYMLDNKMIQFIIREILKTEEYTLEGIAYYARVPFDVIFDAACGNSHLSVTAWTNIVDLYMQVKPEIPRMLFDKLLRTKQKDRSTLALVMSEK